MLLSDLIQMAGIAGMAKIAGIAGTMTDIEISGIQCDSRLVEKGSLFVAVKGTTVDGHDFIGKAVEQGAVAVVCENPDTVDRQKAWCITVPDSGDALGRLASAWYGEPSKRMIVVGVTGTNGKTTIATLLYRMFRYFGYKAGLLSTVCNFINDEAVPTNHTTPDPLTIQQLMARMVEAGCEYAFMEVSSHAVDQKRISGIDFNGGIFTNLTRDHLDYHQTTENYLKAKKKFFDNLPAKAFALTNADDKNGMVMLQNTSACRLTYSLQKQADYKGKIIESHFDGTAMEVNGREVFTRFVGRFNAYNLLAVYGAAVALTFDTAAKHVENVAGMQAEEATVVHVEDIENILLALSALTPVSGRFETINSSQGITAVVDYAHTPDALKNVLNSIHEVLDGKGRVITVVGAGGNRDKGKRPLMAQEAVRQSDQLILTSDNPRFENPDDIIHDMVEGLSVSEKERTLCITDRRQAIKTALALARKGDVALVACKGHENYQEINGVRYPFDDKDIINEIMNK